jgi:Nucleotidyltransferase/DNA polymerase involved in DNA repair
MRAIFDDSKPIGSMNEGNPCLLRLNLIFQGIPDIKSSCEVFAFYQILDVLPFRQTGIPGAEMAREVLFHTASGKIVFDIAFIAIGDQVKGIGLAKHGQGFLLFRIKFAWMFRQIDDFFMGGQLKSLANGRDESNIEVKYTPKNVSLSLGQTLRRPYYPEEALLILREMCDDLSNRLRSAGFLCQKVSVWASYGDRGAFGKQMALPISTDDTETLYQSLKEVFSYGQELPIRGLSINFGSLTSPEKEQVSLFLDDNLRQERKALDHSLDAIRNRYGKNSVLRCSSLLSSSTIRTRHGITV